MIDDGDGFATIISTGHHKARKEHVCGECCRKILPGETYLRETIVFEGRRTGHKTCAHCQVVRGWLSDECGTWAWKMIEEDVVNHVGEGDYPMSVIRLAVGMRWGWRTPTGRLLPVPMLRPATKEQLESAWGVKP